APCMPSGAFAARGQPPAARARGAAFGAQSVAGDRRLLPRSLLRAVIRSGRSAACTRLQGASPRRRTSRVARGRVAGGRRARLILPREPLRFLPPRRIV